MWVDFSGRGSPDVALSFGSEESDVHHWPHDQRLGSEKAFAFETFTISSLMDNDEDNKSISQHPIDTPLLGTSVLSQTCPAALRTNQTPHSQLFTKPPNKLGPPSLPCDTSITSFLRSCVSVKARVGGKKKAALEARGDDDDANKSAEDAPRQLDSLTVNTSIGSSCEHDSFPVGTQSAYDMSVCESTTTDEQYVVVDDFDDEEPLLALQARILQNCSCTNRQPQQPKYVRRPSKNFLCLGFGGNTRQVNLHGTKPALDLKVYRKYKDRGIDFEMPGTPVIAENVSLRQFIDESSASTRSFVAASDSSTYTSTLRRMKPKSLSYEDLQARFNGETELHDELDEVVQRTVEEISVDEEQSCGFPAFSCIHFNAVDTLRAPLDMQLSTLYEDDDEDSDIICSLASSSMNQMSNSISHKLVKYLRRDGMGSLGHCGTSKDEGEGGSGHLLGEKLLDIDNPYSETSFSRRCQLQNASEKNAQEDCIGDVKSIEATSPGSERTDDDEDGMIFDNFEDEPQDDNARKAKLVENKRILPLKVPKGGSARRLVFVPATVGSESSEEYSKEKMIWLTDDSSEISELTDDEYPDAFQKQPPNTMTPQEILAKPLSETKGELMRQFLSMSDLISPGKAHGPSEAVEITLPPKEQDVRNSMVPEGKSATEPSKSARPFALLKQPTFIPKGTFFQSEKRLQRQASKQHLPKEDDKTFFGDDQDGVSSPAVNRRSLEAKANITRNSQSQSSAYLVRLATPGSYRGNETSEEDTSQKDNDRAILFSDDDESDPFADLHCVSRLAI